MNRSLRSTALVLACGLMLVGCTTSKTKSAKLRRSSPSATTSAPAETSSSASAAASPSAKSRAPRKPAAAKPAAVAAAALLKQAGDKADKAGTVSFSLVMNTVIPGQGPVTIKGTGVSALKPPISGRFTMTMPIGAENLTFETLMTPTAMYMKFPKQMAKELGGRAWLKISFAELEKAGGLNFKQLLEQSQQTSPTTYLKSLVAAGGVKKVGTEMIRGTATTHYSGTITPAALTRAYTGKLKTQIEGLLKQMGTSPVAMDVWLAADGLPRRLHQVMTVAGNTTDVTMDFLRFGAKLNATPPPASQTTDLATLMGKNAAA